MTRMKQAVEGIYNEGKIILNEKVSIKGKAKVLVVFLENTQDKNAKKEQLMKTFGSWEDSKDADQIISDIYSSRVSRKDDVSL